MASHGVVLPTRGCILAHSDPADLADRTRTDVVGLATGAADAGFDSVWVGDSVLAKPRHEPLTTLAGLATALDGIRLGTAVYLPALRHPVHVAHQLATVTHLGDCGLAVGVGVGRGPAVEREYGTLGHSYAERGRVLDEVLDVLDVLLAGGTVEYDGEYYDLDGASIGFEPAHQPDIYVPFRRLDPDRGFPVRIHERIVDHAAGWLPHTLDPGAYALGLDRIRGALVAAGRDPDAFDPAIYQNVVVADTEREALDRAREFYLAYYPRIDALTDDELRSKGVFGPPETLTSHVEAYRDAGVETFVTRFPTLDGQRTQVERYLAAV